MEYKEEELLSNYKLIACLKLSTLLYRVDMENGTGWDVQMVFYPNKKIAVSIDRAGHFIFRSWDALIGIKNTQYIAEKLCIPDSDAEGMVKFFEFVFEKREYLND